MEYFFIDRPLSFVNFWELIVKRFNAYQIYFTHFQGPNPTPIKKSIMKVAARSEYEDDLYKRLFKTLDSCCCYGCGAYSKKEENEDADRKR